MGQSAGTGQQPRRFAEGGSTSTVVDFGALAAPDSAVFVPGAVATGMFGRPSPQREAREIYRPAYYDSLGDTEPAARFQMQMPTFNRQGDPMYTKSPVIQPIVNDVTGEQFQRTGHQPYRPPNQDAGLAATPQYQMQMPAFSRPDRSVNTRLQTPVPAGGLFGGKKTSIADPNILAINRALAPQKTQYDSEGQAYTAPVYMDQAQLDSILENPGAYLDYVKYVKGGGDPSQYVSKPQPITMMSQSQREALTLKQQNELKKLLPPAYVEHSGGN